MLNKVFGTIKEYVDFTDSTAIYPQESAKYYIMLGLIGELGEILDKINIKSPLIDLVVNIAKICEIQKKLVRDGYNIDKLILLDKVFEDIEFSIKNTHDYIYLSLEKLNGVHLFEEKPIKSGFTKELGDWFWYFARLCRHFNILDINEILNENVDKLTSRKDRGVLKGDGDNR